MGWVKTTFHRMGSPRFFYRGASSWVLWLYVVGLGSLAVGVVWGLVFAPVERYQGETYRILYIHAPSAHLAQMIYVSAAVAGFVRLVWRMKMADVYIACAAPVGAAVTALALASGIIWGVPTWNTGWVWDVRTTPVLILLFLFFGLIALRQAIARPERAADAVAILAVVGVVIIPIIKYALYFVTALHQDASIEVGKTAIDWSMLWPLFINIAGFYLIAAGIILAAMRVEVLRREYGSDWVREVCLPGAGASRGTASD